MRWRDPRKSDNVEDRRGMRIPGRAVGGGIGGLILLIIVIVLNATNNGSILNGGDTNTGSSFNQGSQLSPEEEKQLSGFISVVLADTEDTWHAVFSRENLGDYREPTLVLFTGETDSGCGYAESAVGPFYCPVDEKVYIDLSFYKDLKDRFGAPGDFAQAYVIAHEVGHHIQNLLGIMDKVHNAEEQAGTEAGANRLSVRLELQADCLAGVWANNAQKARHILDRGDVEEGLNAASSIGDDRLQMESQGYVSPDSFTHGSSAQRVHWFETGLESGNINSCNTF
jgi:uncharacterized protein